MESERIEIWRPTAQGRERVASVSFLKNVSRLNIRPTAVNVDIMLPAEINLRWPQNSEPAPILNNLRATINLKISAQQAIEVGTIRDDDSFLADKTPETILQGEFIWKDALASLIFIEKQRNSDSPTLEIELLGELSYGVKCKRWFPQDVTIMNDVPALLRTPPFQRFRERVQVCYRPEIWRQMIEVAFTASKDNPLLLAQPLLGFLGGNK